MEEICYPELADLGVDSLDDLFSPSFLVAMETQDWTGFEDWRCALESNSPLGSHLPRISDTPFLSILSADDTLVNAEIELQHQVRLCEAGYDIAQVLCEAAGHVEGPGWSLTEQFNWIADRVAGLPLPEVCQTPEVTCCTNTPPDRCSEP